MDVFVCRNLCGGTKEAPADTELIKPPEGLDLILGPLFSHEFMKYIDACEFKIATCLRVIELKSNPFLKYLMVHLVMADSSEHE